MELGAGNAASMCAVMLRARWPGASSDIKEAIQIVFSFCWNVFKGARRGYAIHSDHCSTRGIPQLPLYVSTLDPTRLQLPWISAEDEYCTPYCLYKHPNTPFSYYVHLTKMWLNQVD